MSPVIINLNVGNQLTNISCGHIVVELIKFIAYQRFQIPYPYQWLKRVVNNKASNCVNKNKESLQSECHYRVVSHALQNLDFILKNIANEINGSSMPEEVCIMIGGTSVSCKEAYRIVLPPSCHQPQCNSVYILNDQKVQTIVRNLVMSDRLQKILCESISPTNLYVFIKKRLTNRLDFVSDAFVSTTGCKIPKSSKIVVIDFRSKNRSNVSCCNSFTVFGETLCDEADAEEKLDNLDLNNEEVYKIEPSDSLKWYQSSYVMRGFKDVLVNGSSITNIWLSS